MSEKPCPFCGGVCDPTGWLNNQGDRGPECEKCGATAHNLDWWNTRPIEDELQESIKELERNLSVWVQQHEEQKSRAEQAEADNAKLRDENIKSKCLIKREGLDEVSL